MEKLNIVYLEGIATHVQVSNSGMKGIIEVERSSKVIDKIPFCTANQDFKEGDWISFEGMLVTKNVIDKVGKRHKKMFVYGKRKTTALYYEHRNEVEFNGVLVRKDPLRVTPNGKTIMDIIIAINAEDGKSYYPAVITWGTQAEQMSKLNIGTNLNIQGRFQSREYQKIVNEDVEIRTAYEISVRNIEVL